MKAHRRVQLYRFHAWLGLLAALPLLLIAASGILLGFYDGLRYASPPYRLPLPVERPLGPAALADAARAAQPGGRLEALYLPTAPERAARAVMGGNRRVTLFLHPADGGVIAVRDAEQRDWLDFLRAIHHGKLLGGAGEAAAGALALALPLLWLTGRSVVRGRGWRQSGIHARLGRITGGMLAFLALTGGILTLAKPLREHLYPPPRIAVASGAAELSRILEKGVGIYGRAPLERIVFPAGNGAPILLRFRDGGRLWLDVANEEVLRVETPFSPWLNFLYPLHSGRILGRCGPPLVAALGGALLLLAMSALFIRRRSGRKIFSRKN